VLLRVALPVPVGTAVDWNIPTVLPPFCALSNDTRRITFLQAGFYEVVTQFAVVGGAALQWSLNGATAPMTNAVMWTDDGTGIEVMLNYTYFFQLAAGDVLALLNTSGTSPVVSTNLLGLSQVQILRLA